VYSAALWWRKKNNFCDFWISAFCDVARWLQSEKVELGCTTTNLPLSNGIKILSVFQRLVKSGAQNLTFQSVTNRQTNKKLNVFGRCDGG